MNSIESNPFVKIALKSGATSDIADIAANGTLSEAEKKYIDSVNNEETCAKFLGVLFPGLKNKLRYKYKTKKKFKAKYDDKFKNCLRTNLRHNLKTNEIYFNSMTQSVIEFILGYSISDLMHHLELQFDDKMSWENQGSYWHIDHIYPCSKLKYKTVHDENFKKLWCLDNLRPLEAAENIRKNNKVISNGKT